MSIPIRCYTCGKVVANKWEKYVAMVESGIDEHTVLDTLNYKRYCCRRMFLGNIDTEKDILLKHCDHLQEPKNNDTANTK